MENIDWKHLFLRFDGRMPLAKIDRDGLGVEVHQRASVRTAEAS